MFTVGAILGTNSSFNSAAVVGSNSLWNVGGVLHVGFGSNTSYGNSLLIDAGVVTNVTSISVGGTFSSGNTLIITNAAPTDTGTYRCRALNVAGSAVSNNARLMLALATGNCTGSILDGRIVHNPGSNPFSYRIPNDGSIARVRMTVENMSRRETWSGEFEMGKSRVVSWNGTDHNGGKAPSGIYVVRLKLLSRDGGLISETREAGALGR